MLIYIIMFPYKGNTFRITCRLLDFLLQLWFRFLFIWTGCWENIRAAGDLGRHDAHESSLSFVTPNLNPRLLYEKTF